jgi:very-short-patch-repair endonuclease
VPVCCDGKWYIVDFLINSKTAKKKIVVEIDGGYHNDPEQRKEDELREERLRKKGYEIVRIKNEETEKGAIYDVLFRKMRCVGASDVLNKLTVKKYLS